MGNVVPIFRPEVVKEGVPPELQSALSQVIAEGRFIKGWEVAAFEKELCLGKLCKIRNFSQSPFGGFIFEESDGNFPSGRN